MRGFKALRVEKLFGLYFIFSLYILLWIVVRSKIITYVVYFVKTFICFTSVMVVVDQEFWSLNAKWGGGEVSIAEVMYTYIHPYKPFSIVNPLNAFCLEQKHISSDLLLSYMVRFQLLLSG